jgi:hypothetical protein
MPFQIKVGSLVIVATNPAEALRVYDSLKSYAEGDDPAIWTASISIRSACARRPNRTNKAASMSGLFRFRQHRSEQQVIKFENRFAIELGNRAPLCRHLTGEIRSCAESSDSIMRAMRERSPVPAPCVQTFERRGTLERADVASPQQSTAINGRISFRCRHQRRPR